MSERYDCTDPEGRAEGIPAAASAVRRGEIVVLPTDTVYGIGCDAFDATAVASVLAAKGRGRDMPPPVLIPTARTAQGLATQVPDYAQRLMEKFWPGPLTLVLKAQTSLHWDLGETNGTVALRVPAHELTLELLGDIGPMAVTSANTTGDPAARTVDEAVGMLGESVGVYLDGGPAGEGLASTIVDCTGETPVTLRLGAVSQAELDAALVPEPVLEAPEPDAEPAAEADATPAEDPATEPDPAEDTATEAEPATEADPATEPEPATEPGPEADVEPRAEAPAEDSAAAGDVPVEGTSDEAAETLGEWHDVSTTERPSDGASTTQ
ncbi:L-threonylcarbamoyladenylate synthase [Terracoccus sp. 273MFTsu3.1]|uniref:L-threonylcarbamoyladenylate synthase n=1 Tax=Terracoccus sp. 273MFTsu3.1 TaxID=1172188 RepID=UPI0003607A34|nr:L-threonylcarbamoyladenylate synthase [Terracoccus sp. 273MFTsu3.1]